VKQFASRWRRLGKKTLEKLTARWGIRVRHGAQRVGPNPPKAQIQSGHPKVARLRKLLSEATLSIKEIGSQQARPVQSRVGRAMLVNEATDPLATVFCRGRRQRCQLDGSQTISNPEKRDRIAGEFSLRLRRSFPLSINTMKEDARGILAGRA
jgi:hypothetical protein